MLTLSNSASETSTVASSHLKKFTRACDNIDHHLGHLRLRMSHYKPITNGKDGLFSLSTRARERSTHDLKRGVTTTTREGTNDGGEMVSNVEIPCSLCVCLFGGKESERKENFFDDVATSKIKM